MSYCYKATKYYRMVVTSLVARRYTLFIISLLVDERCLAKYLCAYELSAGAPATQGILVYSGCHYDDVIMGAMASLITSLTIVYSFVYSDADQRNIKAPRHWPLCGEFTGTGEFPAQTASNEANVSIWWRHHGSSKGFQNEREWLITALRYYVGKKCWEEKIVFVVIGLCSLNSPYTLRSYQNHDS